MQASLGALITHRMVMNLENRHKALWWASLKVTSSPNILAHASLYRVRINRMA